MRCRGMKWSGPHFEASARRWHLYIANGFDDEWVGLVSTHEGGYLCKVWNWREWDVVGSYIDLGSAKEAAERRVLVDAL
jgi:hypothetical protein